MLHNAASIHPIGIHDLNWRSGEFIVVHKTSIIGESLVYNGTVDAWVLREGGHSSISTLSNRRVMLNVIDLDVIVKCFGDILLNVKFIGKGIEYLFLLLWAGWPRRTSRDDASCCIV